MRYKFDMNKFHFESTFLPSRKRTGLSVPNEPRDSDNILKISDRIRDSSVDNLNFIQTICIAKYVKWIFNRNNKINSTTLTKTTNTTEYYICPIFSNVFRIISNVSNYYYFHKNT